jgi:molybdate transport system substrate-binding protein
MAKQIEQGAPADIFVSANSKWMKYLVEKQLVAADTERIFAYNQLVFAGEKKSSEFSLESLTGLERIALGNPQSVPAGQYAKQAMERAGVYAALEQEKKLVMAKDVRQALIYADRGEVDGAFVYKTDALLAKHAQILFIVPADFYDRVSYPVALTAEGAKNEEAKAFYDYMRSPEAIAILAKYGFEPNR